MEPLRIESKYGQGLGVWESTRDVVERDGMPSVFIGCSDEGRNETGGHHNRDGFEKLIEWGQQWLKENPKKVETYLIVFEDGDVRTCPGTAARKLEVYRTQSNVIACIPISYHIGQGLNDEGDDDA